MLKIIEEFETRAKEVEDYCEMISSLDQGDRTTVQRPSDITGIGPDLMKTLKAATYLLFYNLIESTMRNAIQAIFDQLSEERISYTQVRIELKRVAIRNLKNISSSSPDLHLQVADIARDIFEAGFNRQKLFSGNVDAKAIRETADEYGFSHLTDESVTRGGSSLLKVKNYRNDLAHGLKTFAEVGRDVTQHDLLEEQNRIVVYLRQILNNVKSYLDNQEYLNTEQRSGISGNMT